MRRTGYLSTIFPAIFLFSHFASAAPLTFDGITFDDGEQAFADEVVSYTPGPDVGAGWNDPTEALGIPGGDSVSLGDFGELILRFTDNSLTSSGDSTADLHIFEIGAQVEWMNVAISTNNVDYIDLGDVLGQPTSIDIDPVSGVLSGTQYSYVRIRDIEPSQSGSPFGEADINAVGAISSAPPAPPESTVPTPGSWLLIVMGILALGAMQRTGYAPFARRQPQRI